MRHFLRIYRTAADYSKLRGVYRAEHLGLAWEAQARGGLLLDGALADPADGAVLLFEGGTPAAASEFSESEPDIRNGLVAQWEVGEWTTVVEDLAAGPVLRRFASPPKS